MIREALLTNGEISEMFDDEKMSIVVLDELGAGLAQIGEELGGAGVVGLVEETLSFSERIDELLGVIRPDTSFGLKSGLGVLFEKGGAKSFVGEGFKAEPSFANVEEGAFNFLVGDEGGGGFEENEDVAAHDGGAVAERSAELLDVFGLCEAGEGGETLAAPLHELGVVGEEGFDGGVVVLATLSFAKPVDSIRFHEFVALRQQTLFGGRNATLDTAELVTIRIDGLEGGSCLLNKSRPFFSILDN